MRLNEFFYAQDVVHVARALLGAHLVRAYAGERLVCRIVETEAYRQNDTACHAHRRKTERNAVMFGAPGHAYVYFVYGMHHMLNVVAEPEACAAAVLIRAVEPLDGITTMQRLRHTRHTNRLLTGGPARLTQALAIDRSLNGTNLVSGDDLWIEAGPPLDDRMVARGMRIGIGYADEDDRLAPWRFWEQGNPCVSR